MDDYFADLPHEVVGEQGDRVVVQRVALEDEDYYSVDLVMPATGYLRAEMAIDHDSGEKVEWEARTGFHEPEEGEA